MKAAASLARGTRRLPSAVLTVFVLGAVLATAGCGGAGYVGVGYDWWYDDPYCYDGCYYPVDPYGIVAVDNYTDTTTFESVLGFYVAPAASGSFTTNLLSAPLPPGAAEDVGSFAEDAYDGEADLELGDLVTWYDVFVPAGDVTTFEVF